MALSSGCLIVALAHPPPRDRWRRSWQHLGAGASGASAIHMNIFGLNPVVKFGTDEQRARMLGPLIAGDEKACFAVTEPTTGLDTTKLTTMAIRQGDRYVAHGQKVWISTAQVADKMLLLARTTRLEDVSSPTEGLSLFYTDLNRDFVDVREIEKMGRKAVDSNEVFIDGLPIPSIPVLWLSSVSAEPPPAVATDAPL